MKYISRLCWTFAKPRLDPLVGLQADGRGELSPVFLSKIFCQNSVNARTYQDLAEARDGLLNDATNYSRTFATICIELVHYFSGNQANVCKLN